MEKRLPEVKSVLITGASSGLGKACAQRLAADGYRVILAGRNQPSLEAVAAECGARYYVCDVKDETATRDMLGEVKQQCGPIHGWVLAAGIQELRPLMMEAVSSLQKTWEVNVLGTLGLLAQALKLRLVAKGGSIVLFSSAATLSGGAGLVSYAASKGALEAAARSLAIELAGQHIRVNSLAPGVILTPMSERYLGKLKPEQVEALRQAHPLGFGDPSDIAGTVGFLLSNDARWITGTTLVIDGGLTAQ